MVWGYKWRSKEKALVMWVLIDLINMLHDDLILFLLGGCEEKDISLHAMDKEPRNDLNIWICLFYFQQVLLTVVFACI